MRVILYDRIGGMINLEHASANRSLKGSSSRSTISGPSSNYM